MSVLGDMAKVYKDMPDMWGMFSETGGDVSGEEDNPISSTREALEGPYTMKWLESIRAENTALYERDVFEVVRKSKRAHLLSTQ